MNGFFLDYVIHSTCFRDLNEEFVELGYLPVTHTFDVWHMVGLAQCKPVIL
jgi:hypothetical protein